MFTTSKLATMLESELMSTLAEIVSFAMTALMFTAKRVRFTPIIESMPMVQLQKEVIPLTF